MKYYKFSKRFFMIRIFEAVLLFLAAFVIPPFAVMFVLAFLSKYIKEFNVEYMPKFVFFALLILCAVSTVFLLIKFFFQKEGVYLYEHSMHFVSQNFNFKYIMYSDITDVEYVGSFYRDKNAHYGRYAVFTANYLGGKTNDCIKITFKNGNRWRCCFLSVEDNDELIDEINKRIDKVL